MTTRGLGAPEVERAFSRARTLCYQLGDPPQLFPILWGVLILSVAQNRLQEARQLGEQLLRLADRSGDIVLRLQAHCGLSFVLLPLGEFTTLHYHAEQGVSLYNPQQHHRLAALYEGHDPGALCLTHSACALIVLGYPTQAEKKLQEVVSLARSLNHPYSLGLVLGYQALLRGYLRMWPQMQKAAEELLEIATEQDFPLLKAIGLFCRGHAVAYQDGGRAGFVGAERRSRSTSPFLN